MILSKRLMAIAEMIPKNVRIIDVGCDHALLDIYLTLQQKNICVASDINSNVLEKTKKMISSFSLEDKIKIVKSDGVEKIDIHSDDLVVIAGMGANTILHIVEQKDINHLIIQSNNDLDVLRKKITQKGYVIMDEKVVFDKDIYYVIIKFEKGKQNYNKEELLFGPILINKKDEITHSYFVNLLMQKEVILKRIPKDNEKYRLFLEEISILKGILHT